MAQEHEQRRPASQLRNSRDLTCSNTRYREFEPASCPSDPTDPCTNLLGDLTLGNSVAFGVLNILLGVSAWVSIALAFAAMFALGATTSLLRAVGQTAVLDHLMGMERGVSGVSLDEEMTNLIQYQQAFAASARVLNTAQQMFDTLLNL